MRILLILDTKSQDKTEIIQDAWNKFLSDYSEISGLKIERTDVYRDFSLAPWIEYLPYKGAYGFDTNWVRNICNQLWKVENGAYDLVIFAVDETNWKEPNKAWGWNLGQWFNDYQVQMVRVSSYLDLGFKMEVLHALDQFIMRELGINLNKYFGVPDFDTNIVHGESFPDWENKLKFQNMSKEYPYKVYDGYKLAITQMGDLLIKTFNKRRNKWQQVLILKKLLELYTKLINLFQKRENIPLFKEEVVHNHNE